MGQYDIQQQVRRSFSDNFGFGMIALHPIKLLIQKANYAMHLDVKEPL